jgi:hypothetical protein
MAPRRRSRAPFALGLDPAAYTPTGLEAYDSADLRKEYARLRREANDRLRKLGQSEFKESKVYTKNVGKFVTLAELDARQDNNRSLIHLIVEAERFVMAKSSSASGQREIRREDIRTLHKHGYTWVNTKNFKDFTDYIEEIRADQSEDDFYHSTTVADDDADTMDGEPEEVTRLSKREQQRRQKQIREAQRRKFDEWRKENRPGSIGKK